MYRNELQFIPDRASYSILDVASYEKRTDYRDFYTMRGYIRSNESLHHISNKYAGTNLVSFITTQHAYIYSHVTCAIWHDILGFPIESAHHFTSPSEYYDNLAHPPGIVLQNGSQANHLGIKLLHQKQSTINRPYLLHTQQAHSSIYNSIDKRYLQSIPGPEDNTSRLSAKDVLLACEQCISEGNEIGGIIATFGTTQQGYIDERIFDSVLISYCTRNKILLHIDAAYGGIIYGIQGDHRLASIKDITHSIVVDPHKFLCIPGCSILYTLTHGQTAHEADYFKGIGTRGGTTGSCIPLIHTHTNIQELGKEGLQLVTKRVVEIADAISQWLHNKGYKLYSQPSNTKSGIIPICVPSEEKTDYIIDALHKQGFLVSKYREKQSHTTNFGIRIVVSPRRDVFTEKNISLFLSYFDYIARTVL